MTQTDALHLLLLPLPSWGHVRPLCVLAGRLASERDHVVVTILMAPSLLKDAHSEISRQFPSAHEALHRIRVVSMFQSNEPQIFKLIKPFADSYPAAYETLRNARPITCATTGTTFDSAPAPVAIIMDFFAIIQLQATRALSGSSVPIIAWATGGASTTIRLFGPESMGGLGNFGARIDAEAARTGKSPDEIGDQIFRHTDGVVVNVPGLPPMFDHEFFPQKLPFEMPVSPIVRGGYRFFMECDGVMISTAEAYERESLEALESWFSSLSKPLYAVGPLLPPNYASDTTSSHTSPGDVEVTTFLDAMLAQHEEQSVLFMSFGTVFWPTVQEYVDEVIEALLEKKFPFILCHASPFAKISSEMSEKVKSSGIGMLTTWSPQQFILNHPATGWFITHCGHGGVMESLSSGIPLICWPFDADQPAAARHLKMNLNVAFELIEVRTGLGLKALHSNGQIPRGTREAVGIEIREVIDACRGEVGKEKRNNVKQLKVELAKAWKEGGAGRGALRTFLDKCV